MRAPQRDLAIQTSCMVSSKGIFPPSVSEILSEQPLSRYHDIEENKLETEQDDTRNGQKRGFLVSLQAETKYFKSERLEKVKLNLAISACKRSLR